MNYQMNATQDVPQMESWTSQIDNQINETRAITNELLSRLIKVNEKLLGGEAELKMKEAEAAKKGLCEPVANGMMEKMMRDCKNINARLMDVEREVRRLEQL